MTRPPVSQPRQGRSVVRGATTDRATLGRRVRGFLRAAIV